MFKYLFVVILFISSVFGQHQHDSQSQTTKATKTPEKSGKKDEPRAAVEVPEEQQARIGLKISKVEKTKLVHTIRTVGIITADERLEAHIHSRVNGWIEKIYADYVGKEIKKGSPLFELYSPEIVSTQEEYLSAVNQGGIGKELAKAALERLKLWEVPAKEIANLKKNRKASRLITFESPGTGFIISKNAIQGMYITPGMELYQIADLSRVWIIITLYEYDVSVIAVGDVAEVQLPYDGGNNFQARISYVAPEIEMETRTAKARIEVANNDQNLKPGMYTNVILKKNLGESLVIPDDALIDTGLRKLVFVKSSPTRFEPREIKVGPRVNNQFAVLSGLKVNEEIVTSAHFFIDAESKMRAAIEKGTPASSGHKHGDQ